MAELQSSLDHLPHRSLMAAGILTYLADQPEESRLAIVDEWRTLLTDVDKEYTLKGYLGSETETLLWKSEGLPNDELSIENAIIINESRQPPLIVDPSSRASEWLAQHLKSVKVEIVNHSDANFVTQVELAARFGKTLIVNEVSSIEPALYPLIRGDRISEGPRTMVLIGDKMVDYADGFKIFFCTRDASLKLPPTAASILTTVNFTTTRAGLTSQLLAFTIQHETPELEKRNTELLQNEERMKMELETIEQSLLEQLANTEGNLLENKTLLASLNKAKENAETIATSLSESEQLQKDLHQVNLIF